MEAQGHGEAGDVDPADQWVFNPDTGTYELRLTDDGQHEQAEPRPPHSKGDAISGDTMSLSRSSASTPSASAASSTPSAAKASASRSADSAAPGKRDRRAPSGGGRRKPRPKRSRTQRVLMWTGGTLALLLIVGCAGAWYLYNELNGNLTKVDVGIENDYDPDEAVNILFIGTDTRAGEGNESYGGNASEGADTTILMHFSKDRTHATGLSIPRDLITDIPDCEVRREDGTTETIPGSQDVRFNTSLGVNGRDPGCVWRTVQELTGVEINHFMMADFNAVKDLSTAVGGVPVCLAEPIDDAKSGFQRDAGRHELEGEDALAFVRTRSSVGTGSDLSRIKLQQQFVASLAREITQGGMLTNPTRMWDLADTATKSLTVDEGIGSIQRLYDLARDVGEVPMSDMNFLTLPVLDNPDEPEGEKATVIVDEQRAAPIFRMLQEDISFTDPPAEESGDGGAEDGTGGEEQPGQPETASPEEVRVAVYNGGEVMGAAQETLSWLQNEQGIARASNEGNAAEAQETTTLEYGADQAAQAALLTEMMGLPDSALHEQPEDAGDAPMVLVLGNDFRGAGEPIEIPAELPEDVTSITADDEDVCAS